MAEGDSSEADPYMGREDVEPTATGDFGDDVQEYTRSTYIVDREFQYRFALNLMIITILFLFLLFGAYLYTAYQVSAEIQVPELKNRILLFLKYAGVFIAAISVLYFLYLLLFTHRIAGPAYHLQNALEKVRDRNIQFTVSLREGDYLHDLASGLNEVLDELQTRNRRMTKLRRRLEKLLIRLEDGRLNSSDAQQEIDELLTEFDQVLPNKQISAGTGEGASGEEG